VVLVIPTCVDITSTSTSSCDSEVNIILSSHQCVHCISFVHGKIHPWWFCVTQRWTFRTLCVDKWWLFLDILYVPPFGVVISNQDGHTVCPGWTNGLSILNTGALCYNCEDKLYVHLILLPGHFKVWTKKLVGHSDEWTIKVGASSHRSKRTWTLYLRIVFPSV